MMRYKLTYLLMMGLILSACATATLSGTTSPQVPSTTGTPTTTQGAVTTKPVSSDHTSPALNDAIEIVIEIVDNMDVLLEPGDCWIDHDFDPSTSLRVDFTVADPGWGPLIGTNKQAGETFSENYVTVHFFRIDRVARAACYGTGYLASEKTAEALAKQLAGIKDFETLEPLIGINAFGYDGYHVVLAVQKEGFDGEKFVGCDDDSYDSWEGPTLSRYYRGPGQVVEFWVRDVEGTLLSIQATWFPDSPAEDVAQLRNIIDSVVITP